MNVLDLIRDVPDNTIVGLVMRLTGGSANPSVVQSQLDRLRASDSTFDKLVPKRPAARIEAGDVTWLRDIDQGY